MLYLEVSRVRNTGSALGTSDLLNASPLAGLEP